MIEATEEGSSRNILLNVYFVDTMITIYIYICIYVYIYTQLHRRYQRFNLTLTLAI